MTNIIINILLVAAALVLTVLLLRKKINLGFVMLLDSAFIAAIARIPVGKTLQYALNGALSRSTIKTIIILFLIMMLENVMKNSGMIDAMVSNLKELTRSNRLAAALLPATLGLLPSAGGARFSCPMVEEVAKENASGLDKAFINYWFRHVWADSFILYPGIILAASLLDVSVLSFFVHMIPVMLMSVILGYVFGLRNVKKEEILRTKPVKQSLSGFLTAMLPIIVVLAAYMLLLNITPYSLEISVGGMLIALFIIKRYPFKKIVETITKAFPVNLVIIIIGVMVFKEVLLHSGAITALSGFMNTIGMPQTVLFVLLPFVGGFTSGLTISLVSLTFPILIPLGLDKNLWFAAVAMASGFIGDMVTPVHLCAVLSADYFKTSLSKLLRKVTIAVIPMLIIVIVVLVVLMV